MIKKFGWALAAVVLPIGSLGSASAADMAVKARPMPMPVPVYNWTGCYIGLSAGAKGARAGDTVFIPAAAPAPASSLDLGRGEADTWLAGGQAGCNYQTGNGFSVSKPMATRALEHVLDDRRCIAHSICDGRRVADLHSDWQASAHGRFGYAMDRTLFYVTGGAAFTEVRATTNWVPFGIFPGTLASQSKRGGRDGRRRCRARNYG